MLFFALICALACATTPLDFKTKLAHNDCLWLVRVNADKMTNDHVKKINTEIKPQEKTKAEYIAEDSLCKDEADKMEKGGADPVGEKIVHVLAKFVADSDQVAQFDLDKAVHTKTLDEWFKGCAHPDDKVSKHIIADKAECKKYFTTFPKAAEHAFTKVAVAAWQKEKYWEKCNEAWFEKINKDLKSKEAQTKFLKGDGEVKLTDKEFVQQMCDIDEWRANAAKDPEAFMKGEGGKTSSFALYGATVTVALLAFIF